MLSRSRSQRARLPIRRRPGGPLRPARPALGAQRPLVTGPMHRAGLRSWHMHLLSLATVDLCIALWIRAKTVDQEERGNAERRALFVGLWPPMFWLIGDALHHHERH